MLITSPHPRYPLILWYYISLFRKPLGWTATNFSAISGIVEEGLLVGAMPPPVGAMPRQLSPEGGAMPRQLSPEAGAMPPPCVAVAATIVETIVEAIAQTKNCPGSRMVCPSTSGLGDCPKIWTRVYVECQLTKI